MFPQLLYTTKKGNMNYNIKQAGFNYQRNLRNYEDTRKNARIKLFYAFVSINRSTSMSDKRQEKPFNLSEDCFSIAPKLRSPVDSASYLNHKLNSFRL